MTVISAIQSIKVWGIRGAIAYLRRWPTLHRLHRSDKHTGHPPQRGITLVGPFSSHGGIAQTMRSFAEMLMRVGIPFQSFDMNDHPSIPKSDYERFVTPRKEFDLGKYSHVIELLSTHAPKSPDRLHTLLMFWEFETGAAFAFPESASGIPILTMSDFNASYFRRSLPSETPVFKIRYPLMLNEKNSTPPDMVRKKYDIPQNAFMVFFNFDYGSSYFRKNPEAVISAFAAAFHPQDNAILVLKTSNADKNPITSKRLHDLSNRLSLDRERLILIEKPLPQADMSGLFNACDTYISLHRGEGFGIGMAEAMSFGKPVIATNYSANTEFCHSGTSIPIPFKMVSPKPNEIDLNAYSHVEQWADPDVDAASAALRRCYEDPSLRSSIGSAAASFIRDYFSPENFKRDVEKFLDGIPHSA